MLTPRPSRLQPHGTTARGVAADRVAPQRARTIQILALHLAAHRHATGHGRSGQAALAHRTRLSGPQGRSSASATTRGADGAASTTTRRCASRPTGSSSPNGALFPSQTRSGHHPLKNLPYPQITDPEALPSWPERHVAALRPCACAIPCHDARQQHVEPCDDSIGLRMAALAVEPP